MKLGALAIPMGSGAVTSHRSANSNWHGIDFDALESWQCRQRGREPLLRRR